MLLSYTTAEPSGVQWNILADFPTVVFPSGENSKSQSLSWFNLKVLKRPLSNVLKSYSFLDSELSPTAKIKPSGLKFSTDRPGNDRQFEHRFVNE